MNNKETFNQRVGIYLVCFGVLLIPVVSIDSVFAVFIGIISPFLPIDQLIETYNKNYTVTFKVYGGLFALILMLDMLSDEEIFEKGLENEEVN